MSIEHTDRESAAVAIAPRVSVADIEAAIYTRQDFTAAQAVEAMGMFIPDELRILSICLIVMRNGFTIIGKAAPASPTNYNAELGRKLAYEDAIRQVWPLMGYSLRDRLDRLARA